MTEKNKQGIQPVRVLPYNVMDWFLNITPEFESEFKYEVDSNSLKEQIVYKITRTRVKEVADISSEKQITLYENFNQYLWAISYSILVLFDEGIHKPTLEKRYTGQFDDTEIVMHAWELFRHALGLTKEYNDRIFFHYPNPETKPNEPYVGLANAIYSSALTFILLHEFGHQYFGHLDTYSTSEQSKSDELTADQYAIGKMAETFNTEKGPTNKMGIVIGMLSLMYLQKELNGGETHPDLDQRIKLAMESLELDELNNLWGIAGLGLNLWAHHFNHDISIPISGDTYKELFYSTYHQLYNFR